MLHLSARSSFLAQVRGAKRIVFFPPAALEGLYPYPTDHPLHRRSRVDLCASIGSQGGRFPRFATHAAPLASDVTLEEGDAILFPAGWFHEVHTESALSVSVGCRYI